MLLDNHLDELAHGASHFPDFLADSVVQFQRDSAGDAFQLHSFLAPFSLVFPYFYCNNAKTFINIITYPFGKSKDRKGCQAFHAPFPDTFRQCNAIHFLPHHIQDQQFKIFP